MTSKAHRHREKKEIRNLSGNLGSRSKSVEVRGGKDESGYLRVLVQAKDEQIEKLVEKIAELHNCNNQFAQENERLQKEMENLTASCTDVTSKLREMEAKSCPVCTEWEKDKDELSKANRMLRDDVTMMKTLVYRLNVQLERYQDKIRKSCCDQNTEEIQTTARCCSDSPIPGAVCPGDISWGSVSTHTLGPLLNAYEEMLREKEDLIMQHEKEINRFTGHFKEIIEENERLQQEMDELRKGKDGWKEEKTRLQAQLEICRGKAELQTRRADLAKEKLVDVLRCYEQKVQAQSLELERLQDAYTRAKSELLSLKNLHSQPEIVVESLRECQKLFEELKSQHDNERTKISSELAGCKKEINDLEEKVLRLREENGSLKNSNEKQLEIIDELKSKNATIKQHSKRIKESRDRLKARLRIALQWAQKLEESREKVKNTWNDLKELEALVRQKESQIRGLHARHLEEIDKLQRKLDQREETIKSILKEKAKAT